MLNDGKSDRRQNHQTNLQGLLTDVTKVNHDYFWIYLMDHQQVPSAAQRITIPTVAEVKGLSL